MISWGFALGAGCFGNIVVFGWGRGNTRRANLSGEDNLGRITRSTRRVDASRGSPARPYTEQDFSRQVFIRVPRFLEFVYPTKSPR